MGDHRPIITAHFEMHGHKADFDFGWCNWSDNGDGVDQRIVDWFRQQSHAAIARYSENNEKYLRKKREEEITEKELKELARLKAKYGDAP